MNGEFLWLPAAAVFLFGLVLGEGVGLMNCRKITRSVRAEVIDLVSVAAQGTSASNAKWAAVRYEVDGKTCLSDSRIQVRASAAVGDALEVRYYLDEPEHLCVRSTRQFVLSVVAFALCVALSVLVSLH